MLRHHTWNVKHNNKNEIELKDWNWIKTMDRKKYRYWFTVNQKPLFLISIPISQLNQGEVDFLIE